MVAMNQSCTLALTPGDPAGIGLDLTLLLARQCPVHRIVVVADRNLLEERAADLNCDVTIRDYTREHKSSGEIECLHIDCGGSVRPGQADPDHADYILKTLDVAVNGCLSGEFDAMVTGPVNKASIILSGTPFTGHTEYLAEKTGADCPVMLLSDGDLRVALATTHLPLSKVPDAITRQRIRNVTRVLHRDLVDRFGLPSPRIGVCGLNPHAGEDGQLGSEETTEIIPAIEDLRAEGIRVSGPIPADTVFTKKRLLGFDAVLSMYHDQGLPVIKHAAFGEVVNVTLGLPIIRTSVDHGTAYDIAGTGQADVSSLSSAVSMAARLSSSVEQ